MGVQCNKCGSRDTEVVPAKKMAEKTGDASFMTATAGAINPAIVVALLKSLFEALGALFNWRTEKEKNARNVVICKACGYWERV